MTLVAWPRVEPRPDRMKRCVLCRGWFPIECFQKDQKNPDRHRNECKACRKERREQLALGMPRYRACGRRRFR